jgi:hypothetical protein
MKKKEKGDMGIKRGRDIDYPCEVVLDIWI